MSDGCGPLDTPLRYTFSDMAGDRFTIEADEVAVWVELEDGARTIMLNAKNAKALARFLKQLAKEHTALKCQLKDSQRDAL